LKAETPFGRTPGRSAKFSAGVSEKGITPTSLLCFFLGFLGLHRFYVGKYLTGILMLVTLGGLGIWQLIDFARITVGSFKDKNGLHLKQDVEPASPISEKSIIPAILLCFFLGFLGFHRFYVGKHLTGILMLITLGGLGIWQLIDLVIIITGSFTDKNGLPLKRR